MNIAKFVQEPLDLHEILDAQMEKGSFYNITMPARYFELNNIKTECRLNREGEFQR